MLCGLKKDSAFRDFSICRHDFFNQYGFGDGDYFEAGEVEIVEHLCQRLAKAIGVGDGRWEPYVESSCHNPHYIKFKNLQTDERAEHDDMGASDWKMTGEIIDEIMEIERKPIVKKDCDFKGFSFSLYVGDFFEKYGFGDGDILYDEDVEAVKHVCHRLAKALGVVDGRWEPYVESSCHNPYYIKFRDLQTGDFMNLNEVDDDDGWEKIQQRIEEITGYSEKT